MMTEEMCQNVCYYCYNKFMLDGGQLSSKQYTNR